MKAVPVEYDEKEDKITYPEQETGESWIETCKRFNDDVHRIRNITDHESYTGLYQCFDENDDSSYYAVEEDRELFNIKHRHFLDNIGLKP